MGKPRAKILVVDDDNNLLDLLVDTLTSIGYEVFGVHDGIEALEKLKQDSFDIMISDVKMPGIDGIALLKKVRRYYPRLPVLFITGVESPEVMGRASPDGFLAKPFRIQHIEEMIENALAGREEKTKSPIRRVMVVDDDDTFRETLVDMLTASNYLPFAVSSGAEALEELEKGAVDAVITDIKMPQMDGIALMHRVKEMFPHMPVVLVTAFFAEHDPEAASEISPADGFLQKPFRAENIVKILNDLTVTPTVK